MAKRDAEIRSVEHIRSPGEAAGPQGVLKFGSLQCDNDMVDVRSLCVGLPGRDGLRPPLAERPTANTRGVLVRG
eukprot:s3114_g4.t1